MEIQMTGLSNLGAVYYGYSLRWPDFWIWFKLQGCIRGCAALGIPCRNRQFSCQTSKIKLLVYYVDSGAQKWRHSGKKFWVQNWCQWWPHETYGSTSPRSARQHWSFTGIENWSRPSTKSVSTESTGPRATTENSFQEGNVWKILGSTLQVFARLFSMSGRQLTIHVPENLLPKIYLWKIFGRKHSKRVLVKRTKCGKKCPNKSFIFQRVFLAALRDPWQDDAKILTGIRLSIHRVAAALAVIPDDWSMPCLEKSEETTCDILKPSCFKHLCVYHTCGLKFFLSKRTFGKIPGKNSRRTSFLWK